MSPTHAKASDTAKAAGGKAPRRKRRLGRGKTESPRFTVFLDRDGVFNTHPRIAVTRFDDFPWIDGAREAFARLNRPDVQTTLVTNQPTVGLGMSRRRTVIELHRRFVTALAECGGRLDNVEAAYRPWSRRYKPRPGMLEDAADKFAAAGHAVDKARAVMIGDKPKDAQAADAFGVSAILVATTYDRQYLDRQVHRLGLSDVCVVDDLDEAVDEILERIGGGVT